MKTCKNCGCELGEDDQCFTVNAGLPEEYIQCDGCHDDQWDRNDITMCEACGQWYEVDKLHRRDTHSEFTPCPNCGCDIVEALTESEFDTAYGSGTTGVYEDNSGVAHCKHCDAELLCNKSGDMPQTCHKCKKTLDWSAYRQKGNV